MKRYLLLLICLLFSSPASAAFTQTWCTKPLGYQQYTSLAAATALTSVPAGTIYIVISVEGQAIRWRDDGTNPTASVGMPVASGSSFSYTANFSKIKFIQQAASATVDVYFCGP